MKYVIRRIYLARPFYYMVYSDTLVVGEVIHRE